MKYNRENAPNAKRTLLKLNKGTEVSELQLAKAYIKPSISVTLLVSYNGTEVREVQPIKVSHMLSTLEVSRKGADKSDEQS